MTLPMLAHRLVAFCLAGTAVAQGTVTVPASALNRDGGTSVLGAGFVRACRVQLLFGTSHLGGMSGRDITAVRFRRDGTSLEHTAGRASLTVSVSASSSLDVRSPSAVFADNHRTPPTVVFQGLLALPFSPGLTNPNAATWITPHAVTVPFAVPYRYAGGSLCVDMEGAQDPSAPSSWWPLDAELDFDRGTSTPFGQGCGPIASQARQMAHVDPNFLRVGSTPRFVGIGQPGSPAFLFLSAQDLTPGIELTFLGAPGCFVYVTPDTSLGTLVGPGFSGGRPGGAHVELTLPAQPGLLGAVIYSQWAMLAGSSLTTTNALRMQLGATASSLDGAVVVSKPATGAVMATNGRVDIASMAVVQFDYR